jgi:hypothetical protein
MYIYIKYTQKIIQWLGIITIWPKVILLNV